MKKFVSSFFLFSFTVYSMEKENQSIKDLIKENEAYICVFSSDLPELHALRKALNDKAPCRLQNNNSQSWDVFAPVKAICISSDDYISISYYKKNNKLFSLLSNYDPEEEKINQERTASAAHQIFKTPTFHAQKLICSDHQWILLEGYDENHAHKVCIANPSKGVTFKPDTQRISEPFNSFAVNEAGEKFILTTPNNVVLCDFIQNKIIGLERNKQMDDKLPVLNGDITKDGSKFLFVTPNKIMINTFRTEAYKDEYISLNLRSTTINQARFNPHGTIIAIATINGVALFDIPTQQQVSLVNFPVNCLTYNQEGNILALGTDTAVYITDYKPLAESLTLQEHRLLKELRNNPAQKVLTAHYWKKIFNDISSQELKEKLISYFNISLNEQK